MPFGRGGNVIKFDNVPGIQEIEATLTNCTQELDGLMFLNSTFIDSHLLYSGKSALFFPDTNVIVNSTLELSPDVDINRSDIHHLICAFHWKSVSQGAKEQKSICD
jgi:hypothetical protein